MPSIEENKEGCQYKPEACEALRTEPVALRAELGALKWSSRESAGRIASKSPAPFTLAPAERRTCKKWSEVLPSRNALFGRVYSNTCSNLGTSTRRPESIDLDLRSRNNHEGVGSISCGARLAFSSSSSPEQSVLSNSPAQSPIPLPSSPLLAKRSLFRNLLIPVCQPSVQKPILSSVFGTRKAGTKRSLCSEATSFLYLWHQEGHP
ncbi:hypothetical protein B0T16DRAFT_405168 [Cercophora newfieldiana]|uniref:Uncharacterized protein n=1 Tax=Cercophora newfieldiana TaxID=92897 RepID=A0AA40CVD4_9PEZI|nr:hypothetical protein B0T16DRAFT_405168 [Cercophora newfieldiana]